jgi:RNase P subunit RPR2
MASTAAEAGEQGGSRLGVGVCLNVIGLLLIAGAGVLMYRSYKRYRAEKPQTIVQQIDLTGDLSLERLKCQSCGAALAKDNIDVKAGAVVVTCPYCGTSYEIEEEPKW